MIINEEKGKFLERDVVVCRKNLIVGERFKNQVSSLGK
jgi:hypothetical protein